MICLPCQWPVLLQLVFQQQRRRTRSGRSGYGLTTFFLSPYLCSEVVRVQCVLRTCSNYTCTCTCVNYSVFCPIPINFWALCSVPSGSTTNHCSYLLLNFSIVFAWCTIPYCFLPTDFGYSPLVEVTKSKKKKK